jgi:hypothetical protein
VGRGGEEENVRAPLDAIGFLTGLGFRFRLDWDGELLIDAPAALDPQQVRAALLEHRDRLKLQVQTMAHWERHQCVGGPFNGRRHGLCPGSTFAIRVRRGEWAGYVVRADGRAAYTGTAATEAAAKKPK